MDFNYCDNCKQIKGDKEVVRHSMQGFMEDAGKNPVPAADLLICTLCNEFVRKFTAEELRELYPKGYSNQRT